MFTNTMFKQQLNQNKAFTLIETLIVIFVLGIGILSIVVLITRNLSLTQQVHTHNTAMILAREGIELTYNYKNTNELLWYEWNCAQRLIPNENSISNNINNCGKYFWSGDGGNYTFTIEGILPWQSQVLFQPLTSTISDFYSLWTGWQLYLTGITVWWVSFTGYTHNIGQKTPYARYIQFSGMNNIPNNSPIKPSDIHHINSVVLYNNGGKTGEVALESFISNPR